MKNILKHGSSKLVTKKRVKSEVSDHHLAFDKFKPGSTVGTLELEADEDGNTEKARFGHPSFGL
jgi:hypothetical protein